MVGKQKRTAGRKKQHAEILDKVNRWIGEGTDSCREIHNRCEQNSLFVAGDTQWEEGDAQRQADKDRPHMPMNRILGVVNLTANREILQRYKPKAYGRTREDHGWNEVCNVFLDWQREQSETEHEESMAFRDLMMSGYGVMHKFFDDLALDGRGAIVDEHVPVWWMLWDSRSRKQCLVDRRWHICGRPVPVDELREEYGTGTRESRAFFRSLDDGSELAIPKNTGGWDWGSVRNGRWYSRADEELFVVEAEWREVKTRFKAAVPVRLEEYAALLSDPASVVELPVEQVFGEEVASQMAQSGLGTIDGALFAQMPEDQQDLVRTLLFEETEIEFFETRADLERFRDYYFGIVGEEFEDFAKDQRWAYRYAIITADQVLDEGERQSGFTYEFMTAFPKVTRDHTEFFGVVDVAKGPQDWRNTFLSLVLTRLATSPKPTILFEESAVQDPDTFFNQLANPRGAVKVPDGFIASNRFLVLNPPTFPPMERELIALADQAVNEVAGLTGLDTGAQTDLRRISGRVVSQAQEARSTHLALPFDSLRRYRRRSGMATLRMMEEFYDTEEVIRIVGAERAEMVADVSEWPGARQFDVRIDESPVSPDERMEMLSWLTQHGILSEWINSGMVPLDVALDWFPMIAETDKERIRQHEAKQDQMNQLMQFLQSHPQGAQLMAEFQGGAPAAQ